MSFVLIDNSKITQKFNNIKKLIVIISKLVILDFIILNKK